MVDARFAGLRSNYGEEVGGPRPIRPTNVRTCRRRRILSREARDDGHAAYGNGRLGSPRRHRRVAGVWRSILDARSAGHVRAIFARRGFRRLLSVRLTTQLGDGCFQVALGVSIFFNPDQQVDPLGYAVAFTMVIAPYTLLGPYVGVFLDRWRRRTVLAVTNTARAGLLIPIAALVWNGGSVWVFGTLAMIVITLNRFVLAGMSTSQPHVVDRPELVTANAFATTAGAAAYGAGLGTGMAATYVFGGVLDSAAAGYAAAAALAAPLMLSAAAIAWRSFSPDGLGPDASDRGFGGIWPAMVTITRGMLGGFGHLWRRRGTAYIIIAQAGYRLLYGILAVTTLAAFRGYFHDPAAHPNYEDSLSWLGAIVVAGQIGALSAAVATPRMTRLLGPGRWAVGLLALVTAVIAVTGSVYVAAVFVAATFCVNIASQGVKIVLDTSIQTNCEDDFRGRLFSLNDAVFNFSFVVGMFIGATLLPADGHAPWLLLGTAASCLCLTVWFGWASRRFAPYVVGSP